MGAELSLAERYKGRSWDHTEGYRRINRWGREPPEASHCLPNTKVPCTWGPVIAWGSVAARWERTDNSTQTEKRVLRDNCWDLAARGMQRISSRSQDHRQDLEQNWVSGPRTAAARTGLTQTSITCSFGVMELQK